MEKRKFFASVFVFLWRLLKKLGPRQHKDVKKFDDELKNAGGLQDTAYKGVKPVDVDKIVGSVSRWKNLRSDFFYKYGKVITERFIRIGQAMKMGKILPAIDLYKIKRYQPDSSEKNQRSEYYVVDGHHRVAMAKKLGKEFLDANIVEYKVKEKADKNKTGTGSDENPREKKKPPSNPEISDNKDKPESKQSPSEK